MSDKIKVLVVEPEKPCRVQEIYGLEEMQTIVGGYIQAVYPFQDEVVLVCNEEGKNLGLPCNRPLTNDQGDPYDMICGTFFLAGQGAEDFTSLTEEQIKKFSALYDNMVVLIVEHFDPQADITPDDAMSHFAISCQISFRIANEDQRAGTQKDAFIDHVTGIFNSDEVLAERTVGDLSFSFHGQCAEARYTFACCTTDEPSAEFFSEQCIRRVQAHLEGYGYKLEKIDCVAERLDNDPPRAEETPRKQETQKKKKGNRYER